MTWWAARTAVEPGRRRNQKERTLARKFHLEFSCYFSSGSSEEGIPSSFQKETPWVKTRPKDLDRILSVLEERNVPVQFHTGEDQGCYPHELLPFVKRHPRLRVDFAHCRPYRETIDCLKQCPNLFTDTAFMSPENYPELVAAGVEDRVMFGTDLPLQAGFYKGSIDELYANDLEGAREYGYSEAVMSGNFFRFLGTTP